jgi:hypothetical protein
MYLNGVIEMSELQSLSAELKQRQAAIERELAAVEVSSRCTRAPPRPTATWRRGCT